MPFYFGGTSLLIIVVVTMDFMAQLQAHMMTHQYEGAAQEGQLARLRRGAVRSSLRSLDDESRTSVRKICRKCKIVRRKRRGARDLRDPRHKQRQG